MTPQEQQVIQARLVVACKVVEDRRRMAHRIPEKVWDLVDALRAVAAIREEVNDFQRAERLYKEALGHARDARKPRPEVIHSLQSHLGYLYERLSEPEKAMGAYQEAMKFSEMAREVPGSVAAVFQDSQSQSQPLPAEESGPIGRLESSVPATSVVMAGPMAYSSGRAISALSASQPLPINARLSAGPAPAVLTVPVTSSAPRVESKQSSANLAHVFRLIGDEQRAAYYARQAEAQSTAS